MFREEFYTNYLEISIHPPREGWDRRGKPHAKEDIIFQSTHPVRGGTIIATLIITFSIYFNPPTP